MDPKYNHCKTKAARHSPMPDRTMRVERSQEIMERQISEHADAYLLVALRPDGQPIVVSSAETASQCLALNSLIERVCEAGICIDGSDDPS